MNKVPISVPSNSGRHIFKLWNADDVSFHKRIMLWEMYEIDNSLKNSKSGSVISDDECIPNFKNNLPLITSTTPVIGSKFKIPFGFYLTVGYEKLTNAVN